ncbi:inositol 1-monophosphatase-like protein, partial [Thalassiosira pseudonana CCMP1335]
LLSTAIAASQKAGEIILGNAGGAEVLKSKANSRDLLTLIDPLCEKTIRETVLATFPNHDFLGEEDTPPGKEASALAIDAKLSNNPSNYLWIVDPIDGTSNFVHGMPLCMPSIAVAYKGEVVVGVIHDPHRQETFTAVRGRGAYMNNERITVGQQRSIGDAIVAMGSPPAEESMKVSLAALPILMPKVRTIRMIGSAALMLAWVANGRLTAYWEYDLSSWDVAAGSILIEEAGGKITDLEDGRWGLRTRKICGSNGGRVHEEILEALREAGVV